MHKLAELSQGWSQHLNYVAAGQAIWGHGGSQQQVIEPGKAMKEQYYFSQVDACSGRS
ncbi:MAG: hypothetical protein OXE78_00420 [Gammaproteobacteria bacterium]|nr:hypothetical protein [Gammaproteobacteria bacterium]MCY4358735.1 hypothetical protein [Gammaproteobacteria bacterium]